jgi:hypothetical protein
MARAKPKRTAVGQEIIQGAKEVLAAMRGDKRKGRVALRFARVSQKTAGRVHLIPSVDVAEVRPAPQAEPGGVCCGLLALAGLGQKLGAGTSLT